jgi:hypothetical protein
MLENLHLHLVYNRIQANHRFDELSLFPGSASPIRDLLLSGIACAWLPPSTLLSHLVNLWIHCDAYTMDDVLSQLSGGFPNLQKLSPELKTLVSHSAVHPIQITLNIPQVNWKVLRL